MNEGTIMKIPLSLLAGSIAALIACAGAAMAQDTRTGRAAYGDWKSDAPGVMRKILPADVEAPAGILSFLPNRSRVVPRPAGANVRTMPGFKVEQIATGLRGARIVRVAPNGDIFIAQSRPEGKITVLRLSDAGDKTISTFADGLKDAYGIAFYPPGPDPRWVYVGMEGKVVRIPYKAGDMKASAAPETIVADLPIGGHWTRDVVFSPDGKTMYVAVGSVGNVAADMGARPDIAKWDRERGVGAAWDREDWRAAILTYTPDGKNKQMYASGIRNCSGLAVQPGTGTLFCATNERDLMGDNTPPDYVTSVRKGGFYGWPWYYIGGNEDTRPGGGRRPDLRDKVIVPDVLIQPHSAPLGMAFNTGGMFPEAWKGDAFVALHGSWNRSVRTGYKIVRLPANGNELTGEYQDFVTGFNAGDDDVWGRPVGVAFAKDGSLIFTEDGNGVVYRVTYNSKDK
jgi:glucose/arabinose dehydrogenase